jgi:hypothetical protein
MTNKFKKLPFANVSKVRANDLTSMPMNHLFKGIPTDLEISQVTRDRKWVDDPSGATKADGSPKKVLSDDEFTKVDIEGYNLNTLNSVKSLFEVDEDGAMSMLDALGTITFTLFESDFENAKDFNNYVSLVDKFENLKEDEALFLKDIEIGIYPVMSKDNKGSYSINSLKPKIINKPTVEVDKSVQSTFEVSDSE